MIRTARAEERARPGDLVAAHLGPAAAALPILEVAPPADGHVNVQAGMDAWLAADGPTNELAGVVGVTFRGKWRRSVSAIWRASRPAEDP